MRINESNSWPCTGHPKNPTLCQRVLSNSSGSLGTVTSPWGSCPSIQQPSGGRSFCRYPTYTFPDTFPAIPSGHGDREQTLELPLLRKLQIPKILPSVSSRFFPSRPFTVSLWDSFRSLFLGLHIPAAFLQDLNTCCPQRLPKSSFQQLHPKE